MRVKIGQRWYFASTNHQFVIEIIGLSPEKYRILQVIGSNCTWKNRIGVEVTELFNIHNNPPGWQYLDGQDAPNAE